MDLNQFAAIIFDMDGVLVDSEPLHEEAQRIIFRKYALDVPAEAFAEFKGQREEAVFAYIVERFAEGPMDVDALVAEKHATYGALIDRLQPVAGAFSLVKRLAGEGRRLGLTTSATPENQRQVFDRWGLDAYFDAVVTAADIIHAKPHPEPYLTTARRLGVPPEGCLVFEDSTHGVLSARRAGCTVAGLTTTFSAETLTKAGAHVALASFVDWP